MSITYDEIIGVKKGTKNPEAGSTTSWLVLYSIFPPISSVAIIVKSLRDFKLGIAATS